MNIPKKFDFWVNTLPFAWSEAASGCSSQYTYPQTSIVKRDSIEKTPLDLYRANLQNQVSQQWSYNFCSFFLTWSTTVKSSQYKSFVWINKELGKLYLVSSWITRLKKKIEEQTFDIRCCSLLWILGISVLAGETSRSHNTRLLTKQEHLFHLATPKTSSILTRLKNFTSKICSSNFL